MGSCSTVVRVWSRGWCSVSSGCGWCSVRGVGLFLAVGFGAVVLANIFYRRMTSPLRMKKWALQSDLRRMEELPAVRVRLSMLSPEKVQRPGVGWVD